MRQLAGVVPRAQTQFTVEDLQPATSYTIGVTTESGMVGSLSESDPREITTATSK